MNTDKIEYLKKLMSVEEKLSYTELHYWVTYSGFTTWQFWVNILMLFIPLIVLYFAIDRKKIFLIGFYGLNFHVWFTYLNIVGIRCGLWEYPNRLAPIFPYFSFSASFAPVVYMLVYQWTINHNKNYYIFTLLLSAIFAYIVLPIFVAAGFFMIFKWITYTWLFVFITIVFLWTKMITSIFVLMHKRDELKNAR